MDKRLEILTFTCVNNYGAILQNHAIERWLMDSLPDYEAETVDYISWEIWSGYDPEKSVRSPLFFLNNLVIFSFRLFVHRERKNVKVKAARSLDIFRKRDLHLDVEIEDKNLLSYQHASYDVLVSGSEQVLNPAVPKDNWDVHDLALDVKSSYIKVGYTESDGSSKRLDMVVREAVCDFDDLSVSKAKLRSFIRDKGVESTVVCNPVVSRTCEHWNKLSEPVSEDASKYSLIYLPATVVIAAAVKLKKLTWYSINSLDYISRLLGKDRFVDYSGPADFVKLLKNAVNVVISSFNATVLSSIFQENFFVTAFQENGSRIPDFFSSISFSKALVKRVDDVKASPDCDWKTTETDWINSEGSRKTGLETSLLERRPKLGILSLYYKSENCGGLLQAFALCNVISKLGYDVEQIRYQASVAIASSNESLVKKTLHHLKTDGLSDTVKLIMSRLDFSGKVKKSRALRTKVFSAFEAQIPHSERVYNDDDLAESVDDFDIFVVGSDQVWNWNFCGTVQTDGSIKPTVELDNYLLRFVPEERRKFSYAASLACPYIPDELKETYFDSIKRLDAASIRESANLVLFPDDVRKDISVVVDPTLLLNADEWIEALGLSRERKKGGYIFLYLLSCTKEDRKAVKRMAKVLGLPTVTRPDIVQDVFHRYDIGLADVEDWNMGPKEFVDYIRNASLVITNSFHATVFSMQFHTPFYIFKRDSKVSMHSRLESVADDYKLGDRIISHDCDVRSLDVEGIDWNHVDEVLIEKRKESMNFLLNALQGTNDGK